MTDGAKLNVETREDIMNSMYTPGPATFPVNSRIRLPCGTLYEKLSDGGWHRYESGTLTYGVLLQPDYNFPRGSEMSYNGQRCFIKHGDGWWPVNQAFDTSAPIAGSSVAYTLHEERVLHGHAQLPVEPDNGLWSTSLQLVTGPVPTHPEAERILGRDRNALSGVSGGIQILEQAVYRHGTPPVYDRLVEFGVDISSAALGDVPDAHRPAYKHDLVGKEKVAIRFGFTHVNSCSYRTKQRTIMRSGETTGITRGRLAMLVAQEVRELVDALERNGTPLKAADSRALKFEELVLVDVRRMSAASIQPTIGIHTL